MSSTRNDLMEAKAKSVSKEKDSNVPKQRVLIFQGGGALGAYEAGVFQALYEKMFDDNNKEPLFDIVAGASIGAVNAVILVSHVIRTGSWKDANKTLNDFWLKDIGENENWFNYLLDNPWTGQLWSNFWNIGSHFRNAWNFYQNFWATLDSVRETYPAIGGYFFWPDKYGEVASPESARRYYSYLNTVLFGSPRVLNPAISQPDMKFGDISHLLFGRFDNKPLVQTIKRYWDFENKNTAIIATNENQPRLLLVSVDTTDCTTAVAFDSYKYNGNKCELCGDKVSGDLGDHLNQKHYKFEKFPGGIDLHCSVFGGEQNKHVLFYEGIVIDHLIASMSTHLRYKYPKFGVWVDQQTQEDHQFWDGAYLSNTPLREVLQAHSTYWKNTNPKKETETKGEKQSDSSKIPDLDIYIVNLYPSTERNFPLNADADTIQDREIDIKFHDRTAYDIKVAEQTTDYIDLAKRSRTLLDDAMAILDEGDIDEKYHQRIANLKLKKDDLFESKSTTKKRDGKRRTYKELIDGRFAISKTVYIQRSDDGNTIFGKAFEFSGKTIQDLWYQGYLDTMIQYHLQNITVYINEHGLNDVAVTSIEQSVQIIGMYLKEQQIDKIKTEIQKLYQLCENLNQEDLVKIVKELMRVL